MPSVQGVNRVCYYAHQGSLSESVVIHEREVRDETRLPHLYSKTGPWFAGMMAFQTSSLSVHHVVDCVTDRRVY